MTFSFLKFDNYFYVWLDKQVGGLNILDVLVVPIHQMKAVVAFIKDVGAFTDDYCTRGIG
jgi:hypothetical protein